MPVESIAWPTKLRGTRLGTLRAPSREIYTPRIRESVWTLTKAGRRVDCALLFHGESYGWECCCLHNGELAYGRRFVMKEDALKEAESQRQRLVGEGWTVPVTSHPPDD